MYVNVLDANDNSPKFRQPRYDVQWNKSVLSDATILWVEATDADVGENGLISYRLKTNPSEYFRIDDTTGAITVRVRIICNNRLTLLCIISLNFTFLNIEEISELHLFHLFEHFLKKLTLIFRTCRRRCKPVPQSETTILQFEALNCSEDDCLQVCLGMCVLTVEAEDHGEPKLNGYALVYINLTNTNLHDPEINFR